MEIDKAYRERVRAEALALVNKARMALGKPEISALPRGVKRAIEACPLAIALGGSVSIHAVEFATQAEALKAARVWDVEKWGRCVRIPATLKEFVCLFDQGEFPDLETRFPDLDEDDENE